MTRAFSALGRETFATPVRWEADGWPAIDPVLLNPRPGTRVDVAFDAPLDAEWIAVRSLPADHADLTSHPGALVLHGTGATLDDPRPVFVGRRQEHLRCSVTVGLDASAGVGGLAVRYDERFHAEIEAGDGVITARATLSGIVQEWSIPSAGGRVELHLDARPPAASGGFPRTSDVITLAVTAGGERTELGEVDGRFLSSETTESFTGRVIGVYAVSGSIVVDSWSAEGDDE